MKKQLQKIIYDVLLKLWPDSVIAIEDIELSYPPKNFGDYSTNIALKLASKVKQSPMAVADKLRKDLMKNKRGDFKLIEIAKPGHINFYLSEKYLQDLIGIINEQGEEYGNSREKGEKVMIEYSQPNTHKEFHIGHLRNVSIGNTLVNVSRKAGYDTIAANYIGDTGTHVAKCLWALNKFHTSESFEEKNNKAEFLGKVYSDAAQAIEGSEENEKEFKEIQKKFNEGDSKLIGLWKKTRQWSLDDFDSIYKKLGVSFDVCFYESEEEIEGKKILPELLEKKVVKKSKGAVIADLEQYDLGILVLMRGDGSVLYGLKDIPLAIKKFTKYKIDRSIIVTDIRQDLYFQQVFKILELLGFDKNTIHIGYEFVSLKDGEEMSSRKGNVVSARELFSQVEEKIKKQFPESVDLEKISLGAIKFFILKQSSRTKIELDIDESIKINGDTGPYVQYALARMNGILEKQKEIELKGEKKIELLEHEKELELIRKLLKFPELVEDIAQSYEVHQLPYYAIKLADLFHSFYHECKVLDEKNANRSLARIELVKAAKTVLTETLRLMGVSAPNKM
ncbi:MAG: arginine--tRNA ligase [Patescibacteria group bacterium]|nr:arginine--tRNA ligase [Patescibacteria group bacterium]